MKALLVRRREVAGHETRLDSGRESDAAEYVLPLARGTRAKHRDVLFAESAYRYLD